MLIPPEIMEQPIPAHEPHPFQHFFGLIQAINWSHFCRFISCLVLPKKDRNIYTSIPGCQGMYLIFLVGLANQSPKKMMVLGKMWLKQ